MLLLPVQVTRWPPVGSPGDSRPTWLASPDSSGTSSPTSCSSLRTRPSLLPALFYAVHYTAGPLLRSASHCRPSHSTQCSTLPALLLYAVLHSAGPPTLRSTPHCRPPSTQQWSTLPALLLYAAVIFLFLTQFLSHMTQGIILHAVKVFCIMAFGYMYYLVS